MSATLAQPETRPARPDFEPKIEAPKVPWWKKPPIDTGTLSYLREILGMKDLEELPENLYLTFGLHMALNRWFHQNEPTYKELCDMVLQAANFPVPREGQRIRSGWIVRLKSSNCDGIYVCRGPFGRELVNVYGIWKLLDPAELEVTEEGIEDSQLNRQAARGAREELHDQKPVPPPPRKQ